MAGRPHLWRRSDRRFAPAKQIPALGVVSASITAGRKPSSRLEAALLGEPGLGAGIRRVDADVHHFRYIHAPVAHDTDTEALLVPIRVGNDVDRHFDAERTGELQRLEIAPQRDALAELPQAVLVDRLDAEKDVGDAELLPELEHFLVAKQHVAARFQIEVLADALAGDRLADRKPVLLLDEGDIVDDEYAGLADGGEVLDYPFRADRPIAAAIERPGAAERAIPRASAREICDGRHSGAGDRMSYLPRQTGRKTYEQASNHRTRHWCNEP